MVRKAFTLVELMVTLVLLAILSAMTVVGLRHMSDASNHLSASNAVDRVVLLERTWAAKNGYFAVDALGGSLGDLTLVSGASSSPTEVSAFFPADGSLVVAVLDGSGRCEVSRVASPVAGGEESRETLDPSTPACDASSL